MKWKTQSREKLYLCLWAIAILVVVPFLFGKEIPFFSSSSEKDISALGTFAEEDISKENVPENATSIISADLSGQTLENKTKYHVSENKLSFSSNYKKDDTVLIIHTYGTQCYSEKGYITNSSTLKSEDKAINVVLAGVALKKELNKMGINAIHDETLYDAISYSNAYNLSSEAVRKHIKNNPKIKYVIDIQRDSVFSQNGSCIKAVTTTTKGKTAQIGFISGCDENGADFPHWKNNLSLSYAISQKLYEINPKLSRGVSLLPSGYGQYTSDGYITVEIGTAGNTPTEVKNATAFLAEAFCEIIK